MERVGKFSPGTYFIKINIIAVKPLTHFLWRPRGHRLSPSYIFVLINLVPFAVFFFKWKRSSLSSYLRAWKGRRQWASCGPSCNGRLSPIPSLSWSGLCSSLQTVSNTWKGKHRYFINSFRLRNGDERGLDLTFFPPLDLNQLLFMLDLSRSNPEHHFLAPFQKNCFVLSSLCMGPFFLFLSGPLSTFLPPVSITLI